MQGRLVAVAAVLAALAGAGPAWAEHRPKENSCSDPYWSSTLRCEHVTAGELPQPNLADVPAGPGDIKPFTRVFLTRDPSVRAVDGTFPTMYVDKAICTAEVACGDVPRGQPVASDKWLITFPGGGSCHGELCLPFYEDLARGERTEMSTAADPPTKGLEGIHAPDEERNPHFAGFNRVRIEKSSFDRYMGRASVELDDGTVIHSHGFRMIEQAFEALRNGLRYDAWVARDGEVVAVKERLPALAKAEQVVFVGHSGGAHGLFHNVDRLTALLHGLPGFAGDVRAMFDENFTPGAENEAAFSVPSAGDAYSGVWSGVSSAGGVLFPYDGEPVARTGLHAEQYAMWDAPLDASCLADHPGDGSWRCNDRQHVLLNHISTPFLLKQDLTDPNPEHNDKPTGHSPRWAPEGTTFSPAEFAARVRTQARTLIAGHATRSELGRAFPTFSVWIADCETHAGFYDDRIFFHERIGAPGDSVTLRQWAERFVKAPLGGAPTWRIDGDDGMASGCPPT